MFIMIRLVWKNVSKFCIHSKINDKLKQCFYLFRRFITRFITLIINIYR